jgi:hypothetical protein
MVDIGQVNYPEAVEGRWQVPQGNGVSSHFNLTVREKTRGLEIGGE